MTDRKRVADWWIAAPLTVAGLWGLVLVAAVGVVPLYGETTVDSAGVASGTGRTLVAEMGSGAYAMAGAPLVATILVGCVAIRPRLGPVVAALGVVGLLGIFNLLAMLTIGIFLLPATGALVVAVGVLLDRVLTEDASPQ